MRAVLKELHFPDIDFANGAPASSNNFGQPVQADIGGERSDGADTFSATVCSPMWLTDRCGASGILWGRHKLIGNHFDRAKIAEAIGAFCASCIGETWVELAAQLQRFGHWEFDSYDVNREGPPKAGGFGRLLTLESPERDLTGFWPEQPHSFRLPLRLTLGGPKGEKANFDLTLSTPDQVLAAVTDSGFVLGHGYLVAGEYDLAKVRDAIRHKCEHLWGDTWNDLVAKMSEYAPLRDA